MLDPPPPNAGRLVLLNRVSAGKVKLMLYIESVTAVNMNEILYAETPEAAVPLELTVAFCMLIVTGEIVALTAKATLLNATTTNAAKTKIEVFIIGPPSFLFFTKNIFSTIRSIAFQ